MAILLKQSTAYTFRLGPFVDSTDGNTQENALTIAATDVLLSKSGGALTAKNDATALTGTGANAHYTCVLNTTDTGTLGGLRVWCHVAGALAVYQDFLVVPANVYDSLVAGTDTLQADVTQWLGTSCATPTVAGVPEVDLTHVAGATTNVSALATNVDAILTDTAAMDPKIVGTLAAGTHNPQTGDAYAIVNNGTYGNSALNTDIDAIKAQTDKFAFAGVGPYDVKATLDGETVTLAAATHTGALIPWNAAWDAEVQSECTDALNAYDPPTNAEMEARTPTAAELVYMVNHAKTAPSVTFTGGTTTTAILGNVDGSAASAVDDFYNGRVLIFNAGTLDEQATDITDYVGATKTATITAVTTAVTASHTAIMV